MTPPRRSRHADRLAEFADLALADDAVFSRRGRWRSTFAQRIGPAFDGRIVLDIGCHDASLLADVARRCPTVGLVGIDWTTRSIADGAQRIRDAKLNNVLLLNGRAQELNRIFAPGELDEAWVFHPEPCDAPRERANRLVSEAFLLMLRPLFAGPDSRFVLKTDHAGYYQHALALLGEPEPAAFAAYRANATDRPRLRKGDLVDVSTLPPASPALAHQFRVIHRDDSFPPASAVSNTRPYAGLTTTYERRFLKKRLPIFVLELAPNDRT